MKQYQNTINKYKVIMSEETRNIIESVSIVIIGIVIAALLLVSFLRKINLL